MSCINPNSKEFQEILNVQPNPFLAELEYYKKYNSENAKLNTEDDVESRDVSEKSYKNDSSKAEPFLTTNEEDWNHDSSRDSDVELSDKSLVSLMRKYKNSFKDDLTKQRFNIVKQAVGEREAYRDYFEQNRKVRPPSIIESKIEARQFESRRTEYDNFDSVGTLSDAANMISNAIAGENKTVALNAIVRLSEKMNVPFEIISQEDAQKRLGSNPLPKGYFHNGKVYLVDGLYDENTVFHEFAHPIIKSMSQDNPELFRSLYNQLEQTPFGREIIESIKANESLKEGTSLFMEEAIVRSLEQANAETSKDNSTFFGKLFVAIKQWLRSVFGKEVGRKLDVSKLSSETTLKDFLKMIQEADEIFVNSDFLNAEDVIMFQKRYEAHVEALQKDSKAVTQQVMNEFYEMVARQLGNMQKENDAFISISEGLSNDEKSGVLQQMRLIMEKLSTKSNKTVESLESLENSVDRDMEVFKEKLNSFVSAIAMGQEMFKIFDKKIEILAQVTNIANFELDQLHSLESYGRSWSEWLAKVKKDYTTSSYGTINPVSDLLNEVETLVNSVNAKVKKVKADVVIDVLYNQLVEQYKPIRKEYLDDMARQKKAGNFAEYVRIHEEYFGLTPEEKAELNKLDSRGTLNQDDSKRKEFLNYKKLTGHDLSKEQLRVTASNQLGDSNYLNGLFDGYLSNQDKVISGFGSYLQETFNTIEGNVNSRQAELLNGLQPLLKAAGYDDKVFGEGRLGNDIQQRNRSFKITDGGVEEFEEYQFISNFVNYEFPRAKLKEELAFAKGQYTLNPSEANFESISKAEETLEQFENDYMNRDYTDAYYKLYDVFKSDVGKLARAAIDAIFDEMRIVSDNVVTDPTDFSSSEKMRDLWREYQQLHSGYDGMGEDKTGDAKAISDLLKQFRIDSSKFWEWAEKLNSFQDSFDTYKQALEDAGETVGSDAYNDAIDEWLEHNTTVSIDEDYYIKRKELMDERTEILQFVIAENESVIDIAPMQNKIYEILKKTKDDSGQFNGRELTLDEQATIRDLNEEIHEARKNYIKLSGITQNESDRFSEIRDYYDYYSKFKTDKDEVFYKEVIQKLKDGLIGYGVGPSDIERIKEIDNELNLMSDSASTDAYTTQLQNLINANDDSRDLLVDYAEKMFGISLDDGDALNDEMIGDILNDQTFVQKIMTVNIPFHDWFMNNHYEVEHREFDRNGQLIGEYMIYKKSAAWQFTTPSNKSFYKIHELLDVNGAPVGILELNGKPRVPNMSYYQRKVKDEYKTGVVLRDHVDAAGNLVLANMDNRGQWLPKTMAEGAKDDTYINANYQSMFANNRPLFDLQHFLKNKHLDFQKGLDNSQKLYTSYPRFRKGEIEGSVLGVGREGYLKRKAERFKDTFRRTADDYELGLNAGIVSKDTDVTLTRPLQGKYFIDINDVSTNIIPSMGDHMYSVETFKAMRKVNSFANLFKSTVKDLTMKPEISSYRKGMIKTALMEVGADAAEKTNRIQQINAIIEKNFQGVQLHAMDKPVYFYSSKIISKLSRMMSFSSFALDPIKSLTNYVGGKSAITKKGITGQIFQGEDFSLNDLRKAQIASSAAVGQLMKSQYSNKQKSVQLQLLDALGAIPDNLKKDVNARGSKTFMQSISTGGVFYADRKFLNDSVPVHQFYAILSRHSFMFNGRMTPLNKAVELRDGKVHTKDGVPNEYSISYNDDGDIQFGKEILKIINKHQTLLNKNLGISNEFTQAEYQRFLLGKIMFFMMKFMVGMGLDRYGFKLKKNVATGKIQMRKRINLANQRAEIGSYISMLDSIRQIVSTKGVSKLGKQNYMGLLAVASAIGMHIIWKLTATEALVFNDDDDDLTSPFSYSADDLNPYKKLKHFTTTGLPELPFIDPDRTKKGAVPFDMDDWMKLQALRLVLRVDKEENTFAPLGIGNSNGLIETMTDMLILQSPLQTGGAQSKIGDVMSNIMSPEPDVYSKDAGPYIWQKQGVNKNYNLVFKMIGLTGKLIDPAYAIEQENKRYF